MGILHLSSIIKQGTLKTKILFISDHIDMNLWFKLLILAMTGARGEQ